MSEGITRRQALEVIKKGAAIGSTMFVLNKLFGNPFLKNDGKPETTTSEKNKAIDPLDVFFSTTTIEDQKTGEHLLHAPAIEVDVLGLISKGVQSSELRSLTVNIKDLQGKRSYGEKVLKTEPSVNQYEISDATLRGDGSGRVKFTIIDELRRNEILDTYDDTTEMQISSKYPGLNENNILFVDQEGIDANFERKGKLTLAVAITAETGRIDLPTFREYQVNTLHYASTEAAGADPKKVWYRELFIQELDEASDLSPYAIDARG